MKLKKCIKKDDEPELRPEFIKKIQKTEHQKSIRVKDFRKAKKTYWNFTKYEI